MNPVAKVEAQVGSSCGGVDHVFSECAMNVGEIEQGNALGFLICPIFPILTSLIKSNAITQTLVRRTTYPTPNLVPI